MGLPRAIEAHRVNDLNGAEMHYRRAYEQGQVNEIFYQNFGALLRQQGKLDESKKFYEEGLRRFPRHHGIKRNYANQLRHEKPIYAIELYLSVIRSSFGEDGDASSVAKCIDDVIDLLRKKGLLSWALSLINYTLSCQQHPSASMLMNLLLLIDSGQVSNESQQVVIEAITENYETKAMVFKKLESYCSDDCIFASNTSSISISKKFQSQTINV